MSAIIEASGRVRQLDQGAEPEERITEEQIADASRVARLFMSILKDVTKLRRRWWPESVVHRDRVVDNTGTVLHKFPHNFGGRVHWWVVDWVDSEYGPELVRHSSSDNNTLVLVSYTIGTLSLRIEVAG